jgi:hypothetical protein
LFGISEARITKEAGVPFISLGFVVHWHSYSKVLCLNVTVDRQFYLQKAHTLEVLILNVYLLPVQIENSKVSRIFGVHAETDEVCS